MISNVARKALLSSGRRGLSRASPMAASQQIRLFGSKGEPPSAAVTYRHNGYNYVVDEPAMYFEKNPYIEGMAHYRDQVHEDTQAMGFRDYFAVFVMLGVLPSAFLWAYRQEFQARMDQHKVVQAQFPDFHKIPEKRHTH